MADRRPVGSLEEERALEAVAGRLLGDSGNQIKLDRYVLLGALASGGIGVVHAGYDPQLDRKVAIKLLRPRRGDSEGEKEARTRLAREATALARLSHPNVVQVHDAGTYEDADRAGVFVVMELVEGDELTRWLALRRHGWREVLRVFVQAGRGLAAAHAVGLIHRDFKPANVLLGTDGRPRVLDFGLARLAADASAVRSKSGTDPDLPMVNELDQTSSLDVELTRAGTVMGTPAYMAPEQHRGEATDERTDQYAFCLALYEGLYGERPFAGNTVKELHAAKDAGPPSRPAGPVPRRVFELVAKGLDPDPARRHTSMEVLLAALEHDSRRRWVSLGVGVTLAAGLAGGIWGMSDQSVDARQACERHAAHVTTIWDDQTRQAASAAFSATGRPYAGEAWQSVELEIDAYLGDWTTRRVNACTQSFTSSPKAAGELDRVVLCLDSHLRRAEALIELFSKADAEVVQNSVQATRNLPKLDACEKAPPAPVAAGGAIESAVEIDADLQHAKALREAGKYREGLGMAKRAMDAAKSLDAPVLHARGGLILGDLQVLNGNPKEAVDTFHLALADAERGHDDESAARALVELVRVVGYDLVRGEEAGRLAMQARARIERHALDPLFGERLEYHEGLAHWGAGNYEEALVHLGRALALRERHGSTSDPQYAATLTAMGAVYHNQGDLEQAAEHYKRSAEIWATLVGKRHPNHASVLHNLGVAALDQGRYDEALAKLEESAGIWREALGNDTREVANAETNIGLALAGKKRPEAAMAHQQTALDIQERTLGADHPDCARTLVWIGDLLREGEDPSKALDPYERALSIFESVHGKDHAHVSYALMGLAQTHHRLGDRERAKDRLERTLRIRGADGQTQGWLVEPLRLSAAIAVSEGRQEQAVSLLERAMTDALTDAKLATRAKVELELARALRSSDPDRSIRLAKDAVRHFGEEGTQQEREEASALAKD
jgi:tetratricopeptide (TPR) repeat protein